MKAPGWRIGTVIDPGREILRAAQHPLVAARAILGGVLSVGTVRARIVEVEAYGGDPSGPWPDPASHSYRGRSPRNAVMFGEAGHLYVYRSYGMHFCANVSYGPDGVAGGVLMRAAEIMQGHELVASRRPGVRRAADVARGPGNLGSALGISLAHNGFDLFGTDPGLCLELGHAPESRSGPRVGIAVAADWPWRLWLPNSAAVSAYRRSPRAPA
ncbi:DNA-3-methyladenine glycosylase [Rhodococcus xishaensis]|uniref:Putative 3-methyladenine DNA glycosylase n=1 Tax=Rhodococcus xishaensis TaxID=2487364 RepID=A0A438B484_9NOCA|nr:DNA-3-methyladenine glycosylase [Rhodococcus xishaensis]RVW05777.1 DNA-3-methyladenine glycosylase [Rhodococcus xishaensis]